MPLTPRHPPGRANRKARAYTSQIAQLRTLGYTCEAIRSAIADDGLIVSLSTVQREAAKARPRAPLPGSQCALPEPIDPASAPPPEAAPPSASTAPASASAAVDPLNDPSGHTTADIFLGKFITNSLYRQRSKSS